MFNFYGKGAEIHCDKKGCKDFEEFAGGLVECVNEAKSYDWSFSKNGKQYCPNHKK